MSTDNENWHNNSSENKGAGRDGNRSFNRDGYNRRDDNKPSFNREGGFRSSRPAFNREGGDRPAFNRGDRPSRPSFNREGGDRPSRP
ncbi:MAG: pseudouridine synthase, partial [Bacteroides sp.]